MAAALECLKSSQEILQHQLYEISELKVCVLHCSFIKHCALSLAAQCIVIGPVCDGRVAVFVCGCVRLWVCYHDNSKLRASIFTKLGL